jgi:hypothetical protein
METQTEAGGDTDGAEDRESGGDEGATRRSRKRPGSSKRSKTQHLTIHETLKGRADGGGSRGRALQRLSRPRRAGPAHPAPQHPLSPESLADTRRRAVARRVTGYSLEVSYLQEERLAALIIVRPGKAACSSGCESRLGNRAPRAQYRALRRVR